MQRIAVTGSNGTIGRALCKDLAAEYEIVRIDRAGSDLQIDIGDLESLRRAFDQCTTVIHLAATVLTSAPWPDVQKNNIEGTYNVFEAARQAGCRRVIFASSNHVVGMYRHDRRAKGTGDGPEVPLSADIPPRPDSLYAVSKVFGEALGRYYSDSFGLQVACIRIGSINESDSPIPPRSWLPWRRNIEAEKRFATKWFSKRDFARLVRAILARDVPFGVVYGVGDNAERFMDLASGRELYGFFPLDGAK
jgi:nucleoside-diphosphate-sugar epimerase